MNPKKLTSIFPDLLLQVCIIAKFSVPFFDIIRALNRL